MIGKAQQIGTVAPLKIYGCLEAVRIHVAIQGGGVGRDISRIGRGYRGQGNGGGEIEGVSRGVSQRVGGHRPEIIGGAGLQSGQVGGHRHRRIAATDALADRGGTEGRGGAILKPDGGGQSVGRHRRVQRGGGFGDARRRRAVDGRTGLQGGCPGGETRLERPLHGKTVGVGSRAFDPDTVKRATGHIRGRRIGHHGISGGPRKGTGGGGNRGKSGLHAVRVHRLTEGHRQGRGDGYPRRIVIGGDGVNHRLQGLVLAL